LRDGHSEKRPRTKTPIWAGATRPFGSWSRPKASSGRSRPNRPRHAPCSGARSNFGGRRQPLSEYCSLEQALTASFGYGFLVAPCFNDLNRTIWSGSAPCSVISSAHGQHQPSCTKLHASFNTPLQFAGISGSGRFFEAQEAKKFIFLEMFFELLAH